MDQDQHQAPGPGPAPAPSPPPPEPAKKLVIKKVSQTKSEPAHISNIRGHITIKNVQMTDDLTIEFQDNGRHTSLLNEDNTKVEDMIIASMSSPEDPNVTSQCDINQDLNTITITSNLLKSAKGENDGNDGSGGSDENDENDDEFLELKISSMTNLFEETGLTIFFADPQKPPVVTPVVTPGPSPPGPPPVVDEKLSDTSLKSLTITTDNQTGGVQKVITVEIIKDTTEYQIDVGANTKTIGVTASALESTSKIMVNDQEVNGGAIPEPIPLTEDSESITEITVRVTTQDGTDPTVYTFKVTKEAPSTGRRGPPSPPLVISPPVVLEIEEVKQPSGDSGNPTEITSTHGFHPRGGRVEGGPHLMIDEVNRTQDLEITFNVDPHVFNKLKINGKTPSNDSNLCSKPEFGYTKS